MIKNGFICDYQGVWHNLRYILRFRIMETPNNKSAIYAICEIGQSLLQISSEFNEEEKAYNHLENIMDGMV